MISTCVSATQIASRPLLDRCRLLTSERLTVVFWGVRFFPALFQAADEARNFLERLIRQVTQLPQDRWLSCHSYLLHSLLLPEQMA